MTSPIHALSLFSTAQAPDTAAAGAVLFDAGISAGTDAVLVETLLEDPDGLTEAERAKAMALTGRLKLGAWTTSGDVNLFGDFSAARAAILATLQPSSRPVAQNYAGESAAAPQGEGSLCSSDGRYLHAAAQEEGAEWLKIYREAPQSIRSQILRGGEKGIRLKPGELTRLLKAKGMTQRDLALVLDVSEQTISSYAHGETPLPKGIYPILQTPNGRDDVLKDIIAFITLQTKEYTNRYPYWEQAFEIQRLLRKRGISSYQLLNHYTQRSKVRGDRDLQGVLAIVRQDIPLDEMRGRVWDVLRERSRAVAFYAQERSNQIFREAPKRLGVTIKNMAKLLAIAPGRYYTLATGIEPVPERWNQVVDALEQAVSLPDLTRRLAQVPRRPAPASSHRRRSGSPAVTAEFESYVRRYRSFITRWARYALARYGMNTDFNVEEVTQDVLLALHTLMQRESISEGKLKAWSNRVIRTKVFDSILQARGITKHEANFYFRMRKLERDHVQHNGGPLSVGDLITFDPRLERWDAERALRRYEELGVRFHGLERFFEDLSEAERQKF